ncbi:MAG: hypothetical protein IJY31_04495 [Muribaculaceae bacterium]|nr:hypothetical protein [Muribaculaceae bacterium]
MRVKVELEIEVTGDATEEFLQFELHYNGQCSGNNPFFDEDSESDYSVEQFYIEEI